MSGYGVDWEEDNGLAAEYALGLLTPEEHRLAEEPPRRRSWWREYFGFD